MEKVSDKFFNNLGFTKKEEKEVHDFKNHMGEVKTTKRKVFSLYPNNNIFVTFGHYYSVTVNKFGDKKVSNYYCFNAYNKKTGFKVENNITHIKPTTEQIKSALLVCGIA